MCKHILNAQVSIRAPCCQKFFDCPECHAESQDHGLRKTIEMAFVCKKCKKAFRKDLTQYEESDEYCPHCDNHYVVEAKTPSAMLSIEGEDSRMDSRMLKDERMRYDPRKDFYFRRINQQESEKIDEGGWLQALKDRQAGLLGPDGLPIDPNGPIGADGRPILDQATIQAATRGVPGKQPYSKFNDDDLDWS